MLRCLTLSHWTRLETIKITSRCQAVAQSHNATGGMRPISRSARARLPMNVTCFLLFPLSTFSSESYLCIYHSDLPTPHSTVSQLKDTTPGSIPANAETNNGKDLRGTRLSGRHDPPRPRQADPDPPVSVCMFLSRHRDQLVLACGGAHVRVIGLPSAAPRDQDPRLGPRHWRFHLARPAVFCDTCLFVLRALGARLRFPDGEGGTTGMGADKADPAGRGSSWREHVGGQGQEEPLEER